MNPCPYCGSKNHYPSNCPNLAPKKQTHTLQNEWRKPSRRKDKPSYNDQATEFATGVFGLMATAVVLSSAPKSKPESEQEGSQIQNKPEENYVSLKTARRLLAAAITLGVSTYGLFEIYEYRAEKYPAISVFGINRTDARYYDTFNSFVTIGLNSSWKEAQSQANRACARIEPLRWFNLMTEGYCREYTTTWGGLPNCVIFANATNSNERARYKIENYNHPPTRPEVCKLLNIEGAQCEASKFVCNHTLK